MAGVNTKLCTLLMGCGIGIDYRAMGLETDKFRKKLP